MKTALEVILIAAGVYIVLWCGVWLGERGYARAWLPFRKRR